MNKTLLKIIITIACVIALGVAAWNIAFYILAVRDAPAPDDSAYKTVYNPVPPETNAIVTLEKLVGKVKANLDDYQEMNGFVSEEEWESFLQGDKIDFEMQVPVVVANQEALALLSEAMKKPTVQFAPLHAEDTLPSDSDSPPANMVISATLHTDEDGKVSASVDTSALKALSKPTLATDFFAINKIARMTWQNTKDGKVIFAWDDALANLQFTKRYGIAENVTLINFLVALACQTSDSDLMIKNIRDLEDKEIAKKAAAFLNDEALRPSDFKKCLLRESYAMVEVAVRLGEKTTPKNPREALKFRFIFKPNETRQRMLDMLDAMGKAIDRDGQKLDVPPPAPELDRNLNFIEKYAYAMKPNAIGRMLLQMTYDNINRMYPNTLGSFAPLRVNACAFALRAYWLDHGRLPDSLDELAPEYIKTVPLDIYGGKPVQYDRERGVVYSAGPKLVYGTGEFAREPYQVASAISYCWIGTRKSKQMDRQ